MLPPTQRFAPATRHELTLKSIAELAGVSYGTVSRAINGRDRIAPATTARVLKLVEELGYRPNASARSLHKPHGDLVGLALPSLNYAGLNAIVTGLQTVLDEASLQLLLYPLGLTDPTSRQKAYFELLYDGRLEGTFVTQWTMLDPTVDQLIRSGKPAILLEQDLLDSGLRTLADWLSANGHTSIGVVTGPGSLLEPNITRHTLKRLGLPRCEIFSIAALPQLLTAAEPTALFCPDDETAFEVQERLAEFEIKPLIVGLGDSPAKRLSGWPYLAFDEVALGQRAAHRLLSLLNLAHTSVQKELKFWIQT